MLHTTSNGRPLLGKVAVVTGGSRGIGRGIALRLAERGATIVVSYLKDEESAKDTLKQIDAAGATGMAVRADVSEPRQLAGMMQQARDSHGQIDIFVNNALGNLLGFFAPPLSVTLEQWDEAFQCQTRAYLVGVQEAGKLLRDDGRIIAVSYWPGSHLGGFLPYFAMGTNKAGLEAMTRYFAVALAPRRITVNTVCPGLTNDSIVNALPQGGPGGDPRLAAERMDPARSTRHARRRRRRGRRPVLDRCRLDHGLDDRRRRRGLADEPGDPAGLPAALSRAFTCPTRTRKGSR